MSGPRSTLIRPEVLAGISSLELRAKSVVEGLLAGLHRSPFKGFSVEFAQYRQYAPWDDPRLMDWKVFGRSDRYYIKEYEAETNLRSYLVLDVSASMGYRSEKAPASKLDVASVLTASLAHLMLAQRDLVGLAVFDEQVQEWIPPSGRRSHWQLILHALESVRPSRKTETEHPLHEVAERLKRRGLVVLVTDGFDEVSRLAEGLRHLKFLKHEVIVFQVLDPAEWSFPFHGLVELEELETGTRRMVHADAAREEYKANFRRFIEEYHDTCAKFHVDHVVVTTDEPLDKALVHYLAQRAAAKK